MRCPSVPASGCATPSAPAADGRQRRSCLASASLPDTACADAATRHAAPAYRPAFDPDERRRRSDHSGRSAGESHCLGVARIALCASPVRAASPTGDTPTLRPGVKAKVAHPTAVSANSVSPSPATFPSGLNATLWTLSVMRPSHSRTELARLYIPQQYPVIVTPRRQPRPIRAERHAINVIGVALAFHERLARPCIPQPRRLILTRRGQPRPIRAERHARYGIGMALAFQEELARPCIPQPRRLIVTCRRQPRPVRAERHAPNASQYGPCIRKRRLPVRASHSRAVSSALAVASRVPSGLNATHLHRWYGPCIPGATGPSAHPTATPSIPTRRRQPRPIWAERHAPNITAHGPCTPEE